jgi:hypothetical protein
VVDKVPSLLNDLPPFANVKFVLLSTESVMLFYAACVIAGPSMANPIDIMALQTRLLLAVG